MTKNKPISVKNRHANLKTFYLPDFSAFQAYYFTQMMLDCTNRVFYNAYLKSVTHLLRENECTVGFFQSFYTDCNLCLDLLHSKTDLGEGNSAIFGSIAI